jgi:hypothetical protein
MPIFDFVQHSLLATGYIMDGPGFHMDDGVPDLGSIGWPYLNFSSDDVHDPPSHLTLTFPSYTLHQYESFNDSFAFITYGFMGEWSQFGRTPITYRDNTGAVIPPIDTGYQGFSFRSHLPDDVRILSGMSVEYTLYSSMNGYEQWYDFFSLDFSTTYTYPSARPPLRRRQRTDGS